MTGEWVEDSIPVVDVIASRHGGVWRLTYANLCEFCGRKHYYGAGDGSEPFAGDAIWFSHCTKIRGSAPVVHLVVRETIT